MRITLISVWPCGMACGANSGAALSRLDAKACVTVSAILVDHAPIFPVFAFRFDTPAGASTGSTSDCHAIRESRQQHPWLHPDRRNSHLRVSKILLGHRRTPRAMIFSVVLVLKA